MAIKQKLLEYFSENELDLLTFLCQAACQQSAMPVGGHNDLAHPPVSVIFTYSHLRDLLGSSVHRDQLLETASVMMAKNPTDIRDRHIFEDGCDEHIEWLNGQIQTLQR